MHNCQITKLRKSLLATFMGVVLGSAIVPVEVLSDQYVWGDLGGGSLTDPATCGTAPDPATVTFTMIDPIGQVVLNGLDTPQTTTCGSFTYNTQTQSGSAEIVRFLFFFTPADAKNIGIDAIPSPSNDLGIGNLFMGNMLFDWGASTGIPVSTVWDAQGLLGEMDGTPTSFTLNSDGTIATATAFADTGGFPGVNGSNWTDATTTNSGTIIMGAQPLAMRRENTTNVAGCTLGSCDGVNPSADITQPIIDDTFDNSANNPTSPIGLSGNPMQSGPFQSFNANFDFNNLKLVSFTDSTAPIITLNGSSTIDIIVGSGPYNEQGATCTDAAPLNSFTYTVAISGDTVDTNTIGTYVVDYDCTDDSSNLATTVSRTVNVKGADAVITLLPDGNSDISPVTQECTVAYADAGATCDDPEDGNILGAGNPLPNNLFSNNTSDVDANIGIPGTYSSVWSCQDNDLNLSTVIRDVDVVDTTLPILGTYSVPGAGFINSSGILILEVNDQSGYSNPTLSASDSCDTTLSAATTSSIVNFTLPDGVNVINSSLLYTATDTSANSATDTLSVEVYRSEPVITLLGDATQIVNIGDAYIEQGIEIFDAQDGSISGVTVSSVVTPTSAGTNPASPRDLTVTIDSSSVDTSTEGVYSVTYDVTDFDTNTATQVTRVVQVGVFADGSNFTMLDSNGNVFGGTNDVVFDWDRTFNTDESDTDFSKMKIFSQAPWPFFGFVWTAHNIRVFDQPGTYSFDTTCSAAELDAGITVCNNPLQPGQTEQFITMTVGAGQIGAHILFDWNTSVDIDVVNVWEEDGVWDQHGDTDPKNQLWSGAAGLAPDPTTTWKLVSTDVNNDGVNSSPMVDGPFQGFYANFNAGPGASAPPLEPYTGTAPDTKLGGGLFASPMNPWVLIAVFMTLFGVRRFNKDFNR